MRVTLFILLFAATRLSAQWTIINTGIGENLLDLSHSNGHWAVGIYGGVAYSANNGSTWTIREFRDPNNNIKIANNIRCVHLSAPQQGLASGQLLMGNAQTVVKTSNAFQNITADYINGSGNYPREIYDWVFPSANVGFACGYNYSLIKTVNGGSTWSPVQATTAALTGIDFWNTQAGIAVGPGVALRTSNGGTSWQSMAVPAELLGVSMASASVAYGIGPQQVYRTENGGVSWSATSLPLGGLRCVQAVDETTVLVGTAGGILISSDSGQSWSFFPETRLLTTDSSAYIGVNNFYQLNNEWWAACDQGILMKASLLSPTRPIALAQIEQSGGDCDTFRVNATASVNSNWQYNWWLGNKNLGKANPLHLIFTQTVSDVLRLVVNNGTGTDTASFPLYKDVLVDIPPVVPSEVTSCSGNLLRFQPTGGYNFFWEPFNLFAVPNIKDAVFTGDQDATVIAYYAFGGCYTSDTIRVRILNDRPLEYWTPTFPASVLKWPLACLDFVDSLRGFAIESETSKFWRTVDGGKTWIPSAAFQYQRFYSDVDFITPLIGYAANATLYKSTNGGASWEKVFSENSLTGEFVKVHFLDVNRGLAISQGNNSYNLFLTTDGGSTWNMVSSGGSFGSIGVKCPTPQRCYCIGSNGLGGFVLRSEDAGATWSSVLQTPVAGLGNFDFIGQDSLISMDDSRNLLFSYDGGLHWTAPVSFNPSGIVNSSPSYIGMATAKEGYIGLSTEALIKTFDGGQCWYKLTAAETSATAALDFSFPTSRNWFFSGGEPLSPGQVWRLDSIGAVSQAEPTTQRILLTPNPVYASGQVTVLGTGQLDLWDMNGRPLGRFIVSEPHTTLQLPDLPAGFYVVRLEERGKVWLEKLVVLP